MLAAGGITDFLDNWGRRWWASQPYLQPYLSWIPWMWNATIGDHGGAPEFPLSSTYLPTYLSTHLPFYPHG